MRQRPFQRGFIVLDLLLGISVMLALLIVLSKAASDSREAGGRLAEYRTAVSLAEQTLTALQAGGSLPEAGQERRIAVRIIEVTGAPAGMTWVEVQVAFGRAEAVVSGLVPHAAAERYAKEVPR